MPKQNKNVLISDFCKKNGFKTYEFYKILNRSPELARKIKTNSAGKRVLDEEAMRTAAAILRKDKFVDKQRSSAAKEINILIAQNEELRKEVTRLKCKIEKMRFALLGKNEKTKS